MATNTRYYYVAGIPHIRRDSEIELTERFYHQDAGRNIWLERGLFYTNKWVYVIALVIRGRCKGEPALHMSKGASDDAWEKAQGFLREHWKDLLTQPRALGPSKKKGKRRRR